jgi:hypothetical protein
MVNGALAFIAVQLNRPGGRGGVDGEVVALRVGDVDGIGLGKADADCVRVGLDLLRLFLCEVRLE